MARILVLLADGTEEMEFVITVDMLRRAKHDVVTAAIGAETVTASREVRLMADTKLASVRLDEYDALIVPGGGPGVEAMSKDPRVLEAVRQFHQRNKLVAAVCAGPRVLHNAGVLAGRKYTCYPGIEAHITNATRQDQRVVRDGNIITSQGPGTTFAFALTIIAYFDGVEKAREVARTALVSESVG